MSPVAKAFPLRATTAVLLVCVSGFLVFASTAGAATLGGAGTLKYDDAGATADNSVGVMEFGGSLHYSGTPTLTVSAPCTPVGTTGATCPRQSSHSFLMGSGEDQVLWFTDGFEEVVAMDGGSGNDRLVEADVYNGFEDIGPTNTMTGDGGDDTMTADITGGGSSLIGGPGNDTALLGLASTSLNISLDGIANDGAAGAETSNIDVENVNVASGSVTGSEGANVIKVGNGDSSVEAGGGGDTVTMGTGTDSAGGGPGNDAITTGAGNDTINPGPGADVVNSGEGNDTINARDGESDQIDCGNGIDVTIVDAVDVLSSDCESVDRPASVQPLASSVQPPPNNFSLAGVKPNKKKGTATLTVDVPYPGTLGVTGKEVAKTTREIGAAGRVKLTIKAAGKGERKLRSKGELKLRVVITFTPSGGTASTKVKTVKLLLNH